MNKRTVEGGRDDELGEPKLGLGMGPELGISEGYIQSRFMECSSFHIWMASRILLSQ